MGIFPRVGLKIKNIWNHHLDNNRTYLDGVACNAANKKTALKYLGCILKSLYKIVGIRKFQVWQFFWVTFFWGDGKKKTVTANGGEGLHACISWWRPIPNEKVNIWTTGILRKGGGGQLEQPNLCQQNIHGNLRVPSPICHPPPTNKALLRDD